MEKINCSWCQKKFKPKRSTAKFCTAKCRSASHNEEAKAALATVRAGALKKRRK